MQANIQNKQRAVKLFKKLEMKDTGELNLALEEAFKLFKSEVSDCCRGIQVKGQSLIENVKVRGQYMKEFIRQAVQFSGQCLIKRC